MRGVLFHTKLICSNSRNFLISSFISVSSCVESYLPVSILILILSNFTPHSDFKGQVSRPHTKKTSYIDCSCSSLLFALCVKPSNSILFSKLYSRKTARKSCQWAHFNNGHHCPLWSTTQQQDGSAVCCQRVNVCCTSALTHSEAV